MTPERAPLGLLFGRSPLQHAPRLSDALGVDIWLKRDDANADIALAGNKVRKLELELADAITAGVEDIVIVGAGQSNAVRATAAACARLGLGCHAVVPPRSSGQPAGNLLLTRLLGARLVEARAERWDALETAAQETCEQLAQDGRRARALPLGVSTVRGALAFALAYDELVEQAQKSGIVPATIVHASSSGATAAGLVLGAATSRRPPRVVSVSVAPGLHDDAAAHVRDLAAAAARHAGRTDSSTVIEVVHDWAGPRYGEPGPDALEAIGLLARLEGAVCDPVYSGKALAALVALAREGALRAPIIFWHTGGAPACFTPQASRLLA